MELRKEEEISLYNELARKWQDEQLGKKRLVNRYRGL